MLDTCNFRIKILPGFKHVISYVKGINSLRRPNSTKHLPTLNKVTKYRNQNLI